MNFKNLILTLSVLIFSQVLFAQKSVDDLNKRKLKVIAEDYLFQGKPKKALPYLVAYDKVKPDMTYKFIIAQTYLEQTSERLKALPYLKAIVEEEKNPDEAVYYYLGQAYHLHYKFDEAIEAFNKFLEEAKNKDERRPDVERRIEMVKNAKNLINNPIEVKIENIGKSINSDYPEYVPVISADESVLMFTSRRPASTGGMQSQQRDGRDVVLVQDTVTGEYFEDIFVSININDDWKKPTGVGQNINTTGHDACIGLSPDGQKLFIYRNDSVKYGNIFVCELEGYVWGKPKKLPAPINMQDSWEGSVSISGDESTLFFASNRTSGHGGRDIYMVRKLPDGSYAVPKNLGTEINTPFDDDAPFIHPDGKTLYFSSKGHNSMGGFDIYKTTLNDDGSWSEPQNLGYPINTADDDIYFVLSANGERGYYSSVKEGGYGEKDIWVIHMAKEEKPKPLTMLKGKIKPCDPDKDFLRADILVTDNETGEFIGKYHPNSATGKFIILVPPGRNYNIAIEEENSLFHSENVFVPDQNEYVEINKDINLVCADVGSKIVLRNIFYDYDKATLREESKTELERLHKLMSENPDLVVEISGHTDAKGSDRYNLELSQRRAQSVVNYLVENGVSIQRVVAKGYGERQPIALNAFSDGSDNPEGRQLNRRTELKILGKVGEVDVEVEKINVPESMKIKDVDQMKEAGVYYSVQIASGSEKISDEFLLGFDNVVLDKREGLFKYTSGHFKSLDNAKKYQEEVKSIGIKDAFIVAFKNGDRITIQEAKQELGE